jgi:uncharacterized protein involved in exopolysaccharide biosynthesis
MNELNPSRADPPPGDPAGIGFSQFMPADAMRAPRFGARDLLVNLFYHRTLLCTCMLVGVLIGLAGTWAARTYYTANALLLVFIGPESAAATDVGAGPTTISVDGLKIVQSEIQLIEAEQVVRSAIQSIGVATLYPDLVRPRLFGLLSPKKGPALLGAAMEEFRSDLRVDADPGSNVIRVSFTHPNRAIAVRALQTILDVYLAERRSVYSSSSSSFLNRELARYQRQIDDLDRQIQKLRGDYDVLDMAQDVVLATDRRDGIVQRQNQVRERQVAVNTEVVAVKANLAQQPETVPSFRETTNNTGNDEARNTLVRLEQTRTHLATQYSPDWPGVRDIDDKIRTVQAQIAGNGHAFYFSQRDIHNPAIDVLNNRLAALEVEQKALVQQLSELKVQYKQADQRVASLREADGQLHSLQLSRDITEGIYRQLAARQPLALFQQNVVDERNANLRVVQPPDAPTIGRSMALSYLAGGIFFGVLVGIAATVLATLLRQVYITPSEAERELSLANLGELNLDKANDEPANVDQDISNLAALLRDVTVNGHRLAALQIVSTSDDDGKAELARRLAMEVAGFYDLRTLILDLQGDGRSQAQALDAVAGVADSPSTGEVPIAPTRIPMLAVSVGAPQSVLGDKRSSINVVRQVLDGLRRQFDLILIVTSSDLSNLVAHRLARLVDANMMVLRAEQTRAPVAARLREVILSAGGNMLGFVFVGRKYYVPKWIYRWI